MLDDRERKALHELQEQLVREDPRLARALSGQPGDPPRQRHHAGAVRAAIALAWLFDALLVAVGAVEAALEFSSVAVVLWALWRFPDHWQLTQWGPPYGPGEHG